VTIAGGDPGHELKERVDLDEDMTEVAERWLASADRRGWLWKA
jgi:hypothetical protein